MSNKRRKRDNIAIGDAEIKVTVPSPYGENFIIQVIVLIVVVVEQYHD